VDNQNYKTKIKIFSTLLVRSNIELCLYVNHVDCQCSWSTKETSSNSHTKGSIKVKNAILTINDSNEATLRPGTAEDKLRIKRLALGWVRVGWTQHHNVSVQAYLQDSEIGHSPVKRITGTCGRVYYVCDIHNQESAIAMELSLWGQMRKLMPNEPLYHSYDKGYLDDDEDD
jgi:hypothetical protein